MKKIIAKSVLVLLILVLGIGLYQVQREVFYTFISVITVVGLICWCVDVLDD